MTNPVHSPTNPSEPSETKSQRGNERLQREVARRRTFGIIAHPDAGKTTLTEKILLYAGRVEEAGSVRGRKSQRAVRSDWMKMEQERGVSVTATCLSFDFEGYRLNLLDTPGHQDFSEDTFRTLNAVDAAVMVVDAVKGIESQTIKLCRICAEREIPILTFVNKMDRPGSDPLGVLTQVEEVLGIDAAPINWPIGTGRDFRGLVELDTQQILKFSPVLRGAIRVPVEFDSLQNIDSNLFSDERLTQIREEVELLAGAGSPFDRERFLAGKQTPVFYGSALTNYGVEQFLERFLTLAPPPRNRESETGEVTPTDEDFSGIVFKIQANLDPRHRDRVAFVRICSGRFERDMSVTIARTGEEIRISRSLQLFAQERERLEEAYPGDVLGIVNPGKLQLGDTICTGKKIGFVARWDYAPETFVRVRCLETAKRKQFTRGITQLVEEGAVQLLNDTRTSSFEPVLAAVGQLQFDVVQFRLESEYNTPTRLEQLPYQLARWVHNHPFDADDYQFPMGVRLMKDHTGAMLLMFESRWSLDYCRSQNPSLILKDSRPSG